MTFAWLVRSLPLREAARSEGWSEERAVELEEFRDRLLDEVRALADPGVDG